MILAFSVVPTEVPNSEAEMSLAVSRAVKVVRDSWPAQ